MSAPKELPLRIVEVGDKMFPFKIVSKTFRVYAMAFDLDDANRLLSQARRFSKSE